MEIVLAMICEWVGGGKTWVQVCFIHVWALIATNIPQVMCYKVIVTIIPDNLTETLSFKETVHLQKICISQLVVILAETDQHAE